MRHWESTLPELTNVIVEPEKLELTVDSFSQADYIVALKELLNR